jgi:hypothetical protein
VIEEPDSHLAVDSGLGIDNSVLSSLYTFFCTSCALAATVWCGVYDFFWPNVTAFCLVLVGDNNDGLADSKMLSICHTGSSAR